MEDYYEYLDSNGVTTLYKLIKDDTVALIDSYSVTLNGITTNLDNHVNNADIHTPIATIEGMIDTAIDSLNYATPDYVDNKVSGLVNSAPETLDTLKELSDALGNDPNFATTVANQIGNKASKDDVYTKGETDTLLGNKANSEHSHVVSDITDFPTIPTKVSELTNDSGYITSVSWEDVTSKPKLSQVAISGSYSDLSGTPTIPTKTSQLTNDSGFLTSSNGLITSVSWNDITNKPNFSTVAISNNYNDLDNIPTSLPANGGNANTVGGFTVGTNVPADAKFTDTVYTHPSTHAASMITGLATVATSGSYNDLSNKPTIPKVYNKTLTIQKNGTNVATFTSNSNTDVTADITVPTKVSELSNDSGFITGISWDKVTNKPTLATVASSGSYTDLSNTPTIPTKVSQLENDMGFGTGGDTSDCVHKTGNETINGTKTFTAAPVVSNSATTNGYSIKLNAIARNEVPTQLYHATFRAYDKNNKILGEYCVEKSTTGCTLAHINVRSEDSNGKQLYESLYLNMSNDGSAVRFYPSSNNKMDLGMSNNKWAKIYSDDVVHTSGDETIAGNKTFSNTIISNKELHYKDTKYDWSDTSFNTWCDAGHVTWFDKTGTRRMHELVGAKNGVWRKACYINENQYFSVDSNRNISYWGTSFKFNGKDVALDENLVHKSGDETIAGNKTFTEEIRKKNSALDLQVNPSSVQYNSFLFTDKNDVVMAYLEHIQTTTGVNALGLIARDKNNGSRGIQVTSENNVIPLGDGVVNLGLSGSKWKNVYSNRVSFPSGYYIITDTNDNSLRIIRDGTGHGNNYKVIIQGDTGKFYAPNGFIGNLQGNADTATSANDPNAVHKTGNETIGGVKSFNNLMYIYDNMSNKNNQMDLFTTPANTLYSYYMFVDKNNEVCAYMQYGQQKHRNDFIGLFIHDKNRALHGIQVTTNNEVIPISNNTYSLGTTNNKWANVYANTFNGNSVLCTDFSAFMAQNGGYTFLIRNDGINTYFLMSDKDGTPGTWSTARPLILNNATGVCSINGHADSANYADVATYATTQATSDNSTKIATTAWVRNYVNSVVGSGSVGASISAYYSNATTLTAACGNSTAGGYYPSGYSDYINIAPTVGTIYTGSQLFSSFTPTASGNISTGSTGPSTSLNFTTAYARATFSGAFSASAKYLCTTANAVKFRAYVSQGTSSAMGSPSVVDNSSSKSIFLRIQ